MIQPDGMADDLGGRAMTVVRIGRGLRAASLLPSPIRPPDPVIVTMPAGIPLFTPAPVCKRHHGV
jgi:hypothetical protein